MTNQDMINFLNQIRKILLDDNSWLESTIQPINETFDMAISAIEKQMPKKPKMPLVAYWTCPTCGKRVMYPDEHCIGCGQKIDWTEGEG